MIDHLFINARIVTCIPRPGNPLGLIENGYLVTSGDVIEGTGDMNNCPDKGTAKTVHDCKGKLLTPGLIDCHTHIVFAGNRADEFAMRRAGKSYEEIAKAGGGILSTVRATRAASEDELYNTTLPRVQALMREGVTTLEIKSGYGLTTEDEVKILRVARRLGETLPIRIRTTFLGAHTVPPEFHDSSSYMEHVVEQMLRPVLKEGLADAIDAYQESIAFSAEDVAYLFKVAHASGIPVKLHADQLSDTGGAKLAASFKALSADHIEYSGKEAIQAMAKAGTVAVLLPGAFYALNETQKPNVEALRKAGVPMAVATDCNPGTSPVLSLLIMANMAITLFGLTSEEALLGITANGAKALGIHKETGTLATGLSADFCLWDTDSAATLGYWTGGLAPLVTYFAGQDRTLSI